MSADQLAESASPADTPIETGEAHPPDTAPAEPAAPAPKPRANWIPRLPIISFSLTIAAASVGMMLGILPAHAATLTPNIDTAVVLLFAPLCILVLGILSEAIRLTLRRRQMPVAGPLRRPLAKFTPAKLSDLHS